MKRHTFRMIGLLAALSILSTGGFAEDFQPENYSYEELQTIIRKSTERLAELDRQYAIEHADRKITFGEEEQIIYLKATTQISVYGRVLTNDQDEEGNTFLMVGTSGEDYSDQVIEIKCGKELQAEGIETETLGTFYGIYKAQKIYSEALGTEYTMPGMEAEKIVIPEETEAEAETEKK